MASWNSFIRFRVFKVLGEKLPELSANAQTISHCLRIVLRKNLRIQMRIRTLFQWG